MSNVTEGETVFQDDVFKVVQYERKYRTYFSVWIWKTDPFGNKFMAQVYEVSGEEAEHLINLCAAIRANPNGNI